MLIIIVNNNYYKIIIIIYNSFSVVLKYHLNSCNAPVYPCVCPLYILYKITMQVHFKSFFKKKFVSVSPTFALSLQRVAWEI